MLSPQKLPFVTDAVPFCVWDWDLEAQNKSFLATYDATYFDYLANLHEKGLETDNRRHAATAIRATYFHATDTLFTFLAAVVQSPQSIPGWIHKCHTKQLVDFVRKVSRGDAVHSRLRKPVNWQSLAERLIPTLPETNLQEIRQSFGRFWSRLAGEFENKELSAEHNSIKHGFRVASGAVSLSVAIEGTPGEQAPPSADWKQIGGGEFGSTFFEPEDLGNRDNFRLIQKSANWDAYCLAGRIRLISLSLQNIISFIRLSLRYAPPEALKFVWPSDLNDFVGVWGEPSLSSISMNCLLEQSHIRPMTRNEILESYSDQGAST